ncbi:MAG: hypothetical protein ACE5H0_14540 [Bacteroidota bacterium]
MQISQETLVEIFFAPIEEMGRMVRLVLGLSAGAIVLFVNLLSNIQVDRWVSAFLVASVLSFGAATAWCLRVFLSLLRLRTIIAEGIQDESESWRENVERNINSLKDEMTQDAKTVYYFFVAGIVLAAIFVVAVWLT